MQETAKLYYSDSHLLEFDATVVESQPAGETSRVVLDRTAFYPTSGGQPNDTGLLEGARVVDVLEEDDGRIIHLIEGTVSAGQTVHGKIDPARRVDHLQQHTGQHILSQAFVQAFGAETRSFHLGTESSTIDIELQSATDEQMRAAEDIANAIVFEDRPIRIHNVNEEEAARLPLRKESKVRGEIRVIEIEGFDWSPCGGTHAARAGEVGLIAVKSFERAKKMTRVEFVCGWRALADYRLANRAAVATARLFSGAREAGPDAVARAIQENKTLRKRVRDLYEVAAVDEARRLLSQAESSGDFKLVCESFDDRDLDELKILAFKVIEQEPAVALLGSKEEGAARLVFARSESVNVNVGPLLAESCKLLGGRGGGRPDFAQGGGPDTAKLGEALSAARCAIIG